VSEVPRLWFVIVKKTLFAINKSAKLHSPEKSRATDQLAVCSQHTLYITHETFSAEALRSRS